MFSRALTVFSALCCFVSVLQAQSRVEELRALCPLKPVLVSHGEELAQRLPDTKAVAAWLMEASAACDTVLNAQEKPVMLLAQIRIQAKGKPVFELGGQPELSPSLTKDLLAALDKLSPLNTQFGEAVFRLQSMPPDMRNPFKEASFYRPLVLTPAEAFAAKFEKASLGEKHEMLRQWARENPLPTLARLASGVDPKFEGVIATGKAMVKALKSGAPLDADSLLCRSSSFWRGVMEMAPGNHLIQGMLPLALLADGEVDKANEYLSVQMLFADKQSLAYHYEQQASQLLGLFRKQEASQIQEGIALHDAGKYKDAIKVYRKVLKGSPHSSWARYEIFYSEAHKDGPEGMMKAGEPGGAWDKAAKEIYAYNPLYSTQFTGRRGNDMGALKARLAARMAPKEKNATGDLIIGVLATSALKLEMYPFAALLYWNSTSTKLNLIEHDLGQNERVTLTKDQTFEHFFYCLSKLGCQELEKNLKQDPKAAYAELEQRLDAYRKQ